MRDAALVEHLVERSIPLDVCPTSNLCTKVVARAEEHPLPAMLRSGLTVTLSSDDPAMFGTELPADYRAAARLDLTPEELVTVAGNGITASFPPEAERAEYLEKLDRAYAAWRLA